MAAPVTLQQIRERVQTDLDLQEEVFITPDEINAWINDGIREAEAEISAMGPELHNYFLSKKVLDTVAGQAEYKLPSNIYADKIRAIIYSKNNNNVHKIKPIRNFEEVPHFNFASNGEVIFKYILTQELKGSRLTLFPTPQTTTTTGVITIWYIRNARSLEVDSDECDIPEFVNFIIQYAKVECLKKEGNPMLGGAQAELEQERTLMINTLTARVIDEENTIQPDVSHYWDMDDDSYGGHF